jgi:hypothetical protein
MDADEVEHILLQTGKWALFSVRLTSYVPLSITRNPKTNYERITWKWLSFPVLYNVALNLSLLVGAMFLLSQYNYKVVTASSPMNGETEAYTHIAMSLLFTLTVVGVRCLGICQLRTIHDFWKETVGFLVRMSSSGPFTLRHARHFETIRKADRQTLIFYILSVIFHFITLGIALGSFKIEYARADVEGAGDVTPWAGSAVQVAVTSFIAGSWAGMGIFMFSDQYGLLFSSKYTHHVSKC